MLNISLKKILSTENISGLKVDLVSKIMLGCI